MQPADLVRHCPRCAAARPTADAGQIPFRCSACGLVLFFNPTVAAAAYVFDASGKALFVRRAKEPAKGKLAIPGGFVDVGETAEEALRREAREEVGLELSDVRYLTSFPNRYEYKGVTYPVCDIVFTANAVDPASAKPLDAVAGIEWHRLADVDPDELAFPSLRTALEMLMRV